jgi:hypothetical protein
MKSKTETNKMQNKVLIQKDKKPVDGASVRSWLCDKLFAGRCFVRFTAERNALLNETECEGSVETFFPLTL